MRIPAFFVGFFLTLTILCAATGAVLVFTAPTQFHLLIIGSHHGMSDQGNTDMLLLVSIPKDVTQHPSIVNIPGGLIEGDVSAEGKQQGNSEGTKSAVEHVLQIHVDATAEVTMTGIDNQADEKQLLALTVEKVRNLKNVSALFDLAHASSNVRMHYDRLLLIRFLIGAGVSSHGSMSFGDPIEESPTGAEAIDELRAKYFE